MDGTTVVTFEPELGEANAASEEIIATICAMPWDRLTNDEVLQVAKAYYYFSIQFRENLETACRMNPGDPMLEVLREGECDTDNLSPWPKVAAPGEKLDHDEFMRRLLALQPVRDAELIETLGAGYLNRVRGLDEAARARSMASYEDGGLSRVFAAMLRAPHWHGEGQRAFRYFLEQHILFDTDDAAGHGGLCRHLQPDASVAPLWSAFAALLALAVPRLAQRTPGFEMKRWASPARPVAVMSA
jgi:hypothetical protein